MVKPSSSYPIMEVTLKFTSLVLLAFGCVQASVLPVDKCTLSDKSCTLPAFNKMVPVFTAGMSQFGVNVMDPLSLKDLKVDMAGLKLTVADWKVMGLKDVVIDDVVWNTKRKVIRIELHTDISTTGHYTAGGNLLTIPIEGDGPLKASFKNFNIKANIYYDLVNKDGKDYIKLTKYTFDYEIKDGVKAKLTNLFNGDKALSDSIHAFIHANWRLLVSTFGRNVFDIIVKEVYNNISNFFDHIPIGDIATL